jgi:hypothetical protein
MKFINTAVIAVAFAAAPILSQASEPAPIASTSPAPMAATASLSTIGAASALPISGMASATQARSDARAQVLAMRERAREQYEHDAMWSH